MKHTNRIVSLMLAATMLLVAGCSTADTSWGAEYKGEKAAVGVYIMGQLSSYNKAMSQVENPDKDPLKQDVDGVKGSEWVKERTTVEMAKYFAIKERFEQAGLKLSDEQLASLNELMSYQYGNMKELYAKNGISEASLKDYYTNYYRSDSLFEKLYGPGGERAISETDISKYFGENYRATKYIAVPKTNTETQQALDEAGLAEAKKRAEGYLALAQAQGANFEDVITQWEKDSAKDGTSPHEHTDDPDLHTVIVPKEGSNYPKEYMEALEKAEVGKPFLAEASQYYFVGLKLDVLSKSDYLADAYKTTIRTALKGEEFDQLLLDWGKEILPQVNFNDGAVKKYTANKLTFK